MPRNERMRRSIRKPPRPSYLRKRRRKRKRAKRA